ncbi:Uncharacterised protein [Vibrio cholerae]|nr:Uncharacterised protein [Vibrio cholerae]
MQCAGFRCCSDRHEFAVGWFGESLRYADRGCNHNARRLGKKRCAPYVRLESLFHCRESSDLNHDDRVSSVICE